MASETTELQSQRGKHGDLSELIDRMETLAESKLYAQLTDCIVEYVNQPSVSASQDDIYKLFDNFVKKFANMMNPTKFVHLLSRATLQMAKMQGAEPALEYATGFTEQLKSNAPASILLRSLRAALLLEAGKLQESRDVLDSVEKELDTAYGMDSVAYSRYYEVDRLYYKKTSDMTKFCRSSLMYLKYTPIAEIPESERGTTAFEIVAAALLSEEEYNFGELLDYEVVKASAGSPQGWILDLLNAFNEGRLDLFDEAITKHAAAIQGSKELVSSVDSLRRKMALLALMELAFQKPQNERNLSFGEIQIHCRLADHTEVERAVMRAMSLGLMRGKMDQVDGTFSVNWIRPRVLDKGRLEILKSRIDQWASGAQVLLSKLEEMTPELLVS